MAGGAWLCRHQLLLAKMHGWIVVAVHARQMLKSLHERSTRDDMQQGVNTPEHDTLDIHSWSGYWTLQISAQHCSPLDCEDGVVHAQ